MHQQQRKVKTSMMVAPVVSNLFGGGVSFEDLSSIASLREISFVAFSFVFLGFGVVFCPFSRCRNFDVIGYTCKNIPET